MEDYRKIAIELGQTLISKAPETREDVERMLPELKESEDERILRRIINIVDEYSAKHQIDNTDCVDWLEKQGGQRLAWSEEDKNMLKWIIGYLENKMLNAPISEERTACKNAIDWLLEKQDKQKPADNVEPKFKTGDWVVYDHRTYQVVELPKEGYINLGLRGNGKVVYAPSTYCRNWTLQDAKDGDVLCWDDSK